MLRRSGCRERKPRPEYSSKIEIVGVVIAASRRRAKRQPPDF